MVRRLFVIILALWAGILLFAPWKELYYQTERILEKRQVILADEELREIPAGLRILHPRILWNGFPVAQLKEAKFRTLLFASELSGNGLIPEKTLQRLLPAVPERFVIRYELWRPKRLSLLLNGPFGRAEGEYDLREKRLRLRLTDPKEIRELKPHLKKIDGVWIYERQF